MQGYPAALGVLATAVIIILVWEWRVHIVSLAVQYLLLGLLIMDVLAPQLAALIVLVGLFVCLILTVTAGQVNWDRSPVDVRPEEEVARRWGIPVSGLVRFAVALLMLVGAWFAWLVIGWLADPSLAELPAYFELAAMGLIAFGLLAFVINSEPWRMGLGVFMFLSGVELYLMAINLSTAVLVGVAVLNLGSAVLVSYLVQRRYAFPFAAG
ncbi:MAG: hypothetical protein HC804_06050 [Anaerolineae bacterium]|nr:hypothetical protein [Anaerolineae bacterium]